MTTNSVRGIIKKKELLERVKIAHARLDGKYEELTAQLKDKSGQSDVSKARVIVKKIKSKLDKKTKDLKEGLENLEEDYDWE